MDALINGVLAVFVVTVIVTIVEQLLKKLSMRFFHA